MCNYITNIKSLIILLLISNGLFAAKNSEQKIQFQGKVTSSETTESFSKLIIRYSINDQFIPSGYQHLDTKIDSNGVFEFSLPDLDKPFRIVLVIYSTDKTKKLWSKIYYLEPNDHINIRIALGKQTDTTTFLGKGAEKYKLIEELENQFWNSYSQELKSLRTGSGMVTDSIELNSKMANLADLIIKYQTKKEELIKISNLSTDMKKILNYDYARYFDDWRFRISLFYAANPTYRKQIIKNYMKYKDTFFSKPDEISSVCSFYLSGLLFKNMLELQMNDKASRISLKDYYNTLKIGYSNTVRDKLIGNFVFSTIVAENFEPYPVTLRDSIYSDASKLVKLPYIKEAIDNRILELSKVAPNMKVIESEFTAFDGKKITLSSLKGKILLIDVWFNGCFGCASFHQAFEKDIFPQLKDNKNFNVLSINLDKDPTRWEQGIESKLYTSEKYINVTTGDWFNHPFMKYYNVKGAPYLMLIDGEGKIIYQPKNGTSTQELRKKIFEALNKTPRLTYVGENTSLFK